MKRIIALTTVLALTACGQPSQNTYNEADIGHNAVILYGIVKSVRPVDIKAQTTGVGAVAGAGAGAVGGSYLGRGGGSLIGLIGGAVIGGIAGAVAEQQLENRQGIEYIVKFNSGLTQSIVQNIAKTDKPIDKGECVMVQMSGTYQRVLPTDDSDCEQD
jgi:outer membrane lipoprotein SlyB